MRRMIALLLLVGTASACVREKMSREVPEAPQAVPTSEAASRVATEAPSGVTGTVVLQPTAQVEAPLGALKGRCLLPASEGRCLNHYANYPADLRAECLRERGTYTAGPACSETGMVGKCRDGFPGRETVYFATNESFRSLENVRAHCRRIGGRLIFP